MTQTPKPDTYADPDEKAVTQLGEGLKAGRRRVFFYAASGFDWQPLHRFSHLCDCFVYVEPRAKEPLFGRREVEWEVARRTLEHGQTRAGENLKNAQLLGFDEAYRVLTEVVGPLAEMRMEPWARTPNLRRRPAWGAVQKLKRHVGDNDRIIWLVFLAGSPLIAYRRLFIETGTAPQCLALCKPELNEDHRHNRQWNRFAGWDGELGRLIRQHPTALPKLLMTHPGLPLWPLTEKRYLVSKWLHEWRTPVFAAKDAVWPQIQPVANPGNRRVTVTRKPLNPHTARAVGAIVLSNERYVHFRWPEGVLVILHAPPFYEDIAVPDGPGVMNMDLTGIPLLQALTSIEAVCVERGITKVAVMGLGFEDEADDLALWRQQEGQIRELVFHCGKSDGRFMDFASAADEID